MWYLVIPSICAVLKEVLHANYCLCGVYEEGRVGWGGQEILVSLAACYEVFMGVTEALLAASSTSWLTYRVVWDVLFPHTEHYTLHFLKP